MLRATYCVAPESCKTLCKECRHNMRVDALTCRWCSAYHGNEDGPPPPNFDSVNGHFCGTEGNSICEYLFMEWVNGRKQ